MLLTGMVPKNSHAEVDDCLLKLCSYEKSEEVQALALSLMSEWHNAEVHVISDAPASKKKHESPVKRTKKLPFLTQSPDACYFSNASPQSENLPLFVDSDHSRPKKRVSWAPDDKLCEMREFISDKNLENNFSTFSLQSNGMMAEISYSAPPFLKNPSSISVRAKERGKYSEEKLVQQARLLNVFEAIYLNIPDNPMDPLDPPEYPLHLPLPLNVERQVKLIPLEALKLKIEASREGRAEKEPLGKRYTESTWEERKPKTPKHSHKR